MPGWTTTGSPIDTCASTIASRWATRGSSGTPRACSQALTRYSACARNASLTHGEPDHLDGGVQARAELVPLAAVGGGDRRVGHQRLAQAGMAGAQGAEEVLAHRRRTGTLARALAAATAHRPDDRRRAGRAPRRAASEIARRSAPGRRCSCAAPASRPRRRSPSLTLLVDGEEQAPMAYGMPRLDLLQASDEPTSYRAGFWGMARIGPREAGATVELGVRARLRGGGELEAELGRVPIAEAAAPIGGAPLVAIAMAAFEPPPELFRRQVESIRSQTLTDWVCVVSDDCSDPARFAELQRIVDGDERFVVSRSGPAARLLPQLRAGAGARPGRRALRRPRRPGRRLGPGQARDAGPRDRRRAADLQRPADRHPRRGPGRRDLLVAAGQQPRRHAVAAGGQLRHGRRLAVPARAARRRPAVPAGPVQPLPRPLDRA